MSTRLRKALRLGAIATPPLAALGLVGVLLAVAAWFSMVIITGILGFMLTPGGWLETGGFFAGFFNQTYWPQLLFRTAMMFAIAGAYAALVAATLRDGGRDTVRRIAGRWGLVGLLAAGGFAAWKESGQTYMGTDVATGGPKEMRKSS